MRTSSTNLTNLFHCLHYCRNVDHFGTDGMKVDHHNSACRSASRFTHHFMCVTLAFRTPPGGLTVTESHFLKFPHNHNGKTRCMNFMTTFTPRTYITPLWTIFAMFLHSITKKVLESLTACLLRSHMNSMS